MRIKAFFGLALAAQLCLPYQLALAHSQGTPNASPRSTSATSSQSASPAGTVNLNLASTQASLSAALVAATKSLSINVGGVMDSVTSKSMLTPAEMVAAYQVLNGGQTLKLGASGNAVGGSMSIGTKLADMLSNLVVPANVKVVDKSATMSLTGDLSNAGQFVVVLPGSQATGAVVSADNIFNFVGGTMTAGSASHPLSLTLNALGDINNAGTISSSGDLNLNAGGSVTNALPSGASGAAPLMQAANNLNVFAGSGNVTNAGMMAAKQGNLSLATLATNNFNLMNTGGTLQAINGAINFGSQANTNKVDTNINGGNFLSQTLNIYSGNGTVTANMDQVSSIVNVNAGVAHVTAASDNLLLGNMNLSGDPTFFNTAGSVTIDGELIFSGQALAIVAETNIVSGSGADQIDTSSQTGDGGTITLIAGAGNGTGGTFAVAPSSSGSATVSGLNGGAGDTTSTLTIKGASSLGGYIDLTGGTGNGTAGGNSVTSFNSFSTVSNGGNVTLVAFAGSGSNSGTVTLPTSVPINSYGGSAGNNSGTVTIIAGGAASGTSSGITIGDIYNINCAGSCGASGSGDVFILAATPVINGGTLTINNGKMTGSFNTTGLTPINSIVQTGQISSNNNITVSSGGSVNLGYSALSSASQDLFWGTMQVNSGAAVTAGSSADTTVNEFIQGDANSSVTITTSNNGNIIINDSIATGQTVTLNANGSGSIEDFDMNFQNSASNFILTSGTGTIGTTNNPFAVTFAGTVNVTANTGGSINLNGLGAQSGYVVTDSTAGGNFTLTTDGSGTTTASGITSTTGTVTITTGLDTFIGDVTTNAGSGASGAITVNSGGALQVFDGSIIQAKSGNTSTNVTLTATGAVTVGNSSSSPNPGGATIINEGGTNSAGGTITLQAGSGTLEVGQGSLLDSTNAGVTIQNASVDGNNSPNGTILIDASVNILSGASGSVYIYNGTEATTAVPLNNLFAPPSTNLPANVSAAVSGGAKIYFGTNSITAAGSPNANVSANGTGVGVVFDTGGQSASSVQLGSGVTIAGNPATIPSLDLASTVIVATINSVQYTASSLIAHYQSLGSIGGNLTVNGSGVATGGNAILGISNLSPTTPLTADNIPSSVTVDFSGFSSSNAVSINLGSSSTTKTVTVNGTEAFTNTSGATGTLNITQTNASTNALLIGSTGLLSSDGSLSVTTSTGGSAQTASISSTGTMSATAGSLTVTATGSITTGAMTATAGLTVSTAAGSNGSITFNGALNAGSEQTATLTVDGSGTMTHTSGTITAAIVNFFSDTGAIGASTSASTYISTTAQAVSVDATNASAYISSTGAVSLISSTVGGGDTTLNTLGLVSSGTLTIGAPSSANVFNLSTANGSGAGIVVSSTLTGLGTPSSTNNLISLNADTTGTISQTAGGGLAANTVNLMSGSGNIGGPSSAAITTSAANVSANSNTTSSNNNGVYVANTGTPAVNVAASNSGSGTLQISQLGDGSHATLTTSGAVTGASITLSTSDNGNITLGSTVGNTNGSSTLVILSANGSGSISQSALSDTVFGAAVHFGSTSGNLGTSSASLQVNTAGGSVLPITGGTGTVYVNQLGAGASLAANSASGGNLQYTTPNGIGMSISTATSTSGNMSFLSGGALNVSSNAQLTTPLGNMTLQASSGALTIGNSAIIAGGSTTGPVTSQLGSVTIQNTSLGGTISFGTGVQVTSQQVIGDELQIFLGAAPPAQVAGTAPTNVTANPTGGGQIFFGTNGITGPASTPNATVSSASIAQVIFSTGTAAKTSISLGSSDSINAFSAVSPLTSLDLTQSAVTTALHLDGQKGALTDSLVLNAAGAATGGTLVFPYSALLSGSLSAFNIPTNVGVTLENFSSPINVALTSTSTTKNVILAGSAAFTNVSGTTTGSGLVVSSSPATFAPTYPMLNDSGSLTSAGPMTIIVTNGVTSPLTTSNVITASGTLTAQGALTITGNGAITLSGTVNSQVSTTVTASKVGTSNNSGQVILGKFGATGSVNTISVFGTGSIAFATGYNLVGSTFNFQDDTALTIGSLQTNVLTASTLTFLDTGAVTVYDDSPTTVTIAASPLSTQSTTGAFVLYASKAGITFSGPLAASGTVSVYEDSSQIASSSGLQVNAPVSSVGAMGMIAYNGNLTSNSSGNMTATGTTGTIGLTSYTGSVTLGGQLQSGGLITLLSNSAGANSAQTITINGNVTSNAGITMTAYTGAISTTAALQANGAVTLTADYDAINGAQGISVGSTITTTGTTGTVTLSSYTGGVSISNAINASKDVAVYGYASAASNPTTSISVTSNGSITSGGTVALTSSAATTTGGISLAGGLSAGGAVTLQAYNSGISVSAPLSTSLGAIILYAYAGTVNITGSVGANQATTAATIDLRAYNNGITIAGPVTGNGAVTIYSDYNGLANSNYGVTVTSAGSVTSNLAGVALYAGAGGISDGGAVQASGAGTAGAVTMIAYSNATVAGGISISDTVQGNGLVSLTSGYATTGGINVTGSITTGGAVTLLDYASTTSGGISVAGVQSGGAVNMTADSGALSINGTMNATKAGSVVNLTSYAGPISIAAPVTADSTVTVLSNTGGASGAYGITITNAGSVTSSAGSVSFYAEGTGNTGGITVNGAINVNAPAGYVELQSYGGISNGGAITSAGNIQLYAYSGAISLGANMTAGTYLYAYALSTAGSIGWTAGTLSAGSSSLLYLSTNNTNGAVLGGNIGSLNAPINVNTGIVVAEASKAGDSAYITDTSGNNLTLGNGTYSTNVASTFSATAAGNMSVNGGIYASGTIDLALTAIGNMSINAQVGNGVTTTFNLSTAATSGDAGSIIGTGIVYGSATSTATLTVGKNGNIGEWAPPVIPVIPPVALTVDAGTLNITATPGTPLAGFVTSSVYVKDNYTSAVMLNSSSAGDVLQVTTAGALTVAGALTAPTTTLTSAGAMTVNAAIGSSSSGVNLTFGSALTVSGTLGTLTLGSLSLTSTAGGSIGTTGTPFAVDTPLLSVTTASATVNVKDTATSLSFSTTQLGASTTVTTASAAQAFYTIVGSTLTAPSAPTTGSTLSVTAPSIKIGASIGSSGNLYNEVDLTATTTIAPVALNTNYNIYANSFSFIAPSNGALTVSGAVQTGYIFSASSTTAATITAPTTLTGTPFFAVESGSIVLSGQFGSAVTPWASFSASANASTGAITTSGSSCCSIYATNLSLSTVGASIGTSTASVFVSASNLTLTAGGTTTNVYVNNTLPTGATGSDVTTGAAGGTFYFVQASGNLEVGTITAPTVTLQATNGSSTIQVDTSVGKASGTTTLTSGGSLNLSTILGSTVSLTSTAGAVSGANTSATTLTVNAATGVSVTNSVAVKLNASSSTSGTFDLENAGTITLGGNVSAPTTTLDTTATNCSIALGAFTAGKAGGTTTLNASGTGTITQTGTLQSVFGSTVNLSGGTGAIGTSATVPIVTSATSLTALTGGTTTGNVYVSNGSAVSLGASGAGGTFSLTNAGTVSDTAAITAPTVLLTTTGNANLGTSATNGALQVAAGTLTVSIGTGSAWLADGAAVKLAASTASSYTMTAGGTITVSGALSATTVSLTTSTGSGGGIALGANVGLTSTDSGTKIFTADGSITQTTGNIYGGNIQLTAGGNIGTSTSANVTLSTSTGAQLTSTAGGTTYINDLTSGLTVNNSTSASAYSLVSIGTLTIDGITTNAGTSASTGSITVATSGTNSILQVANNAVITASGGNVTLQNTTTTTGKVVLGTSATSGVDITATSSVTKYGQVNIILGTTVPTSPVKGMAPSGVTINGTPTNVYYGTGITVPGTGSSLTLNAATNKIIFSAGTAGAPAITVNSGTSVNANTAYEGDATGIPSDDSIVDTGDCGDNEEAGAVHNKLCAE